MTKVCIENMVKYFETDEDGQIYPKAIGVDYKKCGGASLTATDEVLTTNNLTTNTTLPVTVLDSPDPANANNSFVKVHKVRTPCGEDGYVPVRYMTRQLLSPVLVTVADINNPDTVNDNNKDKYVNSITYTATAPSTGNWYYDVSFNNTTNILDPNTSGDIWAYAFGNGILNNAQNTDNYSGDQAMVRSNNNTELKGNVVGPGTVLNLTAVSEIRIDTGLAVVTAGGSFQHSHAEVVITFYPAQ